MYHKHNTRFSNVKRLRHMDGHTNITDGVDIGNYGNMKSLYFVYKNNWYCIAYLGWGQCRDNWSLGQRITILMSPRHNRGSYFRVFILA